MPVPALAAIRLDSADGKPGGRCNSSRTVELLVHDAVNLPRSWLLNHSAHSSGVHIKDSLASEAHLSASDASACS